MSADTQGPLSSAPSITCSCPDALTKVLDRHGCKIRHNARATPSTLAAVPARWHGCRAGDREVVAMRDFTPGEVVWSEEAFTCVALFKDMTSSERCSACFGGSCELQRCSRCKTLQYCSKKCQRDDWRTQHKVECSSIAAAVHKNVSAAGLVDLILLGRTIRHKGLEVTSATRAGTIIPGIDALNSMHGHPVEALPSKQRSEVFTLAKLALDCGFVPTTTASAEIVQLLTVFESNNFGAFDVTLKPVASAVLPFTALLNHSCAPNCVLTYTLDVPIRVSIRACRAIASGDELRHAYVDVAAKSADRQTVLQKTYHFHCRCELCEIQSAGSLARPIPDKVLSGTLDGVCAATADEKLRSAEAHKRTAMEVEDIETELRWLKTAIDLEKNTLHPLNLTLFETMRWAFPLAIAVDDFKLAFECHDHVLRCLRQYYQPNHPATALQLSIGGDMHSEIAERTENSGMTKEAKAHEVKAIKMWSEAKEIYSVTHGVDHAALLGPQYAKDQH